MSLSAVREDIIDQIKEDLAVIAGRYPQAELGEVYEEATSCFQALGICNLLVSLDTEGFFRNLILSAYTRRHFLQQSRLAANPPDEHLADEHLAISRNESFFDAIAAGEIGLACEIADLSPGEWIQDGEYEDDFCYYFFFHTYVRGFENPDRDILKKILDRFEKSLEGNPSARFTVCGAFFAKDQEAFREGFQELIRERESQLKNQSLKGDLTFEPKSHVFVEGLALLRIAAKAGFRLSEEYRYCPGIARAPRSGPLPGDIYAQI